MHLPCPRSPGFKPGTTESEDLIYSWPISFSVPFHPNKVSQPPDPDGLFKTDDKGNVELRYIRSASGISWVKFGKEIDDGWVYGRFSMVKSNGNRQGLQI
jgi:hypothetical protein